MIDPRHIASPLELERPRPPVREQPPPKVHRGFTLLWALLRYVAWYARRRVTGSVDLAVAGARFAAQLEELGGMWIKVGQLLAMRADLFGRPFCQPLSALQDRATGFPGEVARAIVEDELGAPLESVFTAWEDTPFAAASIGQIHRARLRHHDVEVAVKVQRPRVADIIALDLRVVRRLCTWADRLRFIPSFRWAEFYEELDRTLTEEVDYRFEAASLREMRKTLKAHKGVFVPKVFGRQSGRRVLVMEFVRGALMADLLRAIEHEPDRATRWMLENGINRRKLARRLLRSQLRQVLDDNLFHADLHPGNIILLRGSRIALIDFGAVGTLEEQFSDRVRAFYQEIARGAFGHAVDIMLMMMPRLPSTDLLPLRDRMTRILRDWSIRSRTDGLPFEQRSGSDAFAALMRALADYRIPASWQWMRIDRATVTLEASLRVLDNDLDTLGISSQLFADMERREAKAALREGGASLRAESLQALETLIQVSDAHQALETDWQRQQARVLGPTRQRVDFLAVVGINIVITVLMLAQIVGVALFVQYRAGEPTAVRVVEALPDVPYAAPLVAAFVTIGVLQLLALRRAFRQPVIELSSRR